MRRISLREAGRAVGSSAVTIAAVSWLMALVLACTLAQAQMGVYDAVRLYIRGFFFWIEVGGVRLPILPGGALTGLVLLANLAAAQLVHIERSWRKAGIWLTHAGLIVLFVGEFASGLLQVETRMYLDEGAAVSYTEDPRELELAVVDVDGPDEDVAYLLRESALRAGRGLTHPDLPFRVKVDSFVTRKGAEGELSGADVALTLEGGEAPRSLIVPADEGVSLRYGGRELFIALRPRRHQLPFELTLQKFERRLYPGTSIPKRFSSRVRLTDPEREERRDVLISMNDPLRYRGLAFYQASYGKDDTLSILNVVRNPGWLLPYLSCVLVLGGMALHFAAKFTASGAAR